MATSLSSRLAFATDPGSTFALLTDPAYVEDVATGTGGHDVAVSVTPTDDGGATVVSSRAMPAKIPSYAKPLVGDSLHVTETRVLGPVDDDGVRHGTADVSFGGAPITMTGSLRLEPDGTGSVLVVEMRVKASVPFVGGKIEGFATEQVQRFLAKEEQIAAARPT